MILRSIRSRLLLTLLLSLAVPFLGFVLLAWRLIREGLERERVELLVTRVAADASTALEQKLSEWRRLIALWVTSPTLGDVLVRGQDTDRLAVWLEKTVPSRVFQLVMVVNQKGNLVVSRLSPAFEPHRQEEIQKELVPSLVTDHEWFEKVMSSSDGFWRQDRHRSPYLYLSTETRSEDPKTFSFAMAMAVTGDDGKRIGAIYCLLDWSLVQDHLDEVAKYFQETQQFKSGYAFLIANDGNRILGHHLRKLYNDTLANHDLPALRSALLDSSREDDRQGSLSYEYPPGKPKHSAWRQLAHEFAPFNWFLGVGVQDTEIYQVTNQAWPWMLGAAVFVGIGLLLAAWLITRLVLRPVTTLQQATTRLASGDLTARAKVRGAHELALLARGFNRMAEDLDKGRENLRRAERDAAWVHIARQVAHEIKNPLTPMRLSAQMLQKALDDGSPQTGDIARRTVRSVLTQIEALRKIAGDFALFAGRVRQDLVPVAIDECLRAVAELYEAGDQAGRAPVKVERGASGATVRAHADDLNRVLINLVNNALDAMSEQSRPGIVRVASRIDDGQVEVTVDDDGPGLAPEVRDHLFEPYFSTKSSGTGLGLAIVKRTIEAFGGTVALEPRVEGGTRAKVRLPVMPGG